VVETRRINGNAKRGRDVQRRCSAILESHGVHPNVYPAVAGMGMLIAYIISVTVLPALRYLLHPPGEHDALGIAIVPVDGPVLALPPGRRLPIKKSSKR
jgi:hypothetical protein